MLRFDNTMHAGRGDGMTPRFFANPFLHLSDHVRDLDVVAQMKEWIRKKAGCHSIAATGMHGIVEAQHDPEFKQILRATDLVVPDGMPLVWLGRRRGHVL